MSSNSRAFDLHHIEPLDPRSHVPLYAQLRERFESLIEQEPRSSVGRFLPSESECVEYFR